MTVELKIDAEQINKYVAQRIIESSIGKTLQEAIDKQVASLSSLYNNPLDAAIQHAVKNEVIRLLGQPEFVEKIHKLVIARTTDDVLNGIISKVWDRL